MLLLGQLVVAQNDQLILKKTLITDWSGLPVYQELVSDTSVKNSWKPEYSYLGNIGGYTLTYLREGLAIRRIPAKPKAPGKYPCIIYNRGGNREFGALVLAHGAITLGQIAKEGFVVIASQYRGNGGSEGKEEFCGRDINDVTTLPEVLKEIEGADTENIGMYGWSRGGMMTYLASTKMTNIKAIAVG